MSHLILFVCTGNVCRSPMAAALFNAKARCAKEHDQFVAQSAGTWALDDQRASSNAVIVMNKRNLDLGAHRGRTVNRQMLQSADLILVITKSHAEALTSQFPTWRKKMH